MHGGGTQRTDVLSHLAANLLSKEGIAALTLEHIHQLAAGIFHRSWRSIDPHKDAYIEIDAQGQHGNNVSLIPVSMPLQQSAAKARRHSASYKSSAVIVNP